jgi:hypothetical protein
LNRLRKKWRSISGGGSATTPTKNLRSLTSSQYIAGFLVAGIGFEPMTFRL